MCVVQPLRKWQLQQLVALFARFIYNMHGELAGIVRELFKLKVLKLNGKGGILHFKGPRNLINGVIGNTRR